MFRQHLKISIRNLWKNKSFSAINIIGLSLGLASVMTLGLMVHQYLTTDDIQVNKDRMYYLKTFSPDGNSYAQTTFPLLYEIQKSAPEVEAATHTQTWNWPWLKNNNKEAQEKTMYVDTGFFRVFSFKLKEGNPTTALKEKFNVVLSQKTADQLFAKGSALGKTIIADDSIPLTVTGVLAEIPTNSTIKTDVLLNIDLLKDNKNFAENANWYNTFAQNYLLLKDGAKPSVLDAKIAGIVKQFYAEDTKKNTIKSVPFSKMREEAGANVKVIITGAIAVIVFILLIIVVNLLNLNAATMYNRTKEVAVRRMIGSGNRSIIVQFCMENALIIFISLLAGFFLFTDVLLPEVNAITGSRFGEIWFKLDHDYPVILAFLVVSIIIVLVAGSYPAFHLTSVKVTDAVKGNIISQGTNKSFIRDFFITIQFALAIVLICAAIVLNTQIRYMKTTSLGFNKDNVIVAKLDLAFKNEKQSQSQFDALLHSLQANPYVKSVSTSPAVPTAYWGNYNGYTDLLTEKKIRLKHAGSDAGYTSAYQIPIIAGRNFNDALSATEQNSVLINESAAKAFGWTNPIGKQIRGNGGDNVYTVIGVMADFHYEDLQQPIEPLLHWYGGKQGLKDNSYLSIKVDSRHSKEVAAQLETALKSIPARREPTVRFMSEMINEQYALLMGILKITNYVAVLTIGIACMGIFGLVALFAHKRVKEVGIRKVLGASVFNITSLLSKDFIRLVFVAFVIATPAAWWLMSKWLQNFAYRITIQWWMFGAAGLLAIIIALLTVGFQAIKAAIANPVESLRSE
ncbi:ABC transporter permease [Segetibacter aerophilus]|uniref:ABC transporter permease n=1 Tax=Segetibacter aerophilus TaxID=670293 RepID=A0A512BB53_9BACT|nr:ABC transporter permease [Segetibacter aerophilus]GEO09202.1 ABC transporter permease [Segetibacter aerophilus]